ncbi:hypothetical protein ACET3Z_030588 [Daucus carota]
MYRFLVVDDGTTCLMVTCAMLKRWQSCEVISADDRREAAIDAGAVSFILKPISADVARNIGTYVIPKMEIGDHANGQENQDVGV